MSEKQKVPPGPKPRLKRALPPPGDFIALGKSSASKPRAAHEVEMKIQMPIRKSGVVPGLASTVQKRKDMNPTNPVAAKQPRTFSPSFGRGTETRKSLDTLPVTNIKVIDAQPAELEDLVINAHMKGDQDEVDGLICGAIKTLRLNRLKPDPMLYLTLTNLAKSKPAVFTSKQIVEHLLQFLRRENISTAVKPKPNILLSIMTCNILLCAFQNEDSWPQSFMKVYVEDALSDRAWIDNEHNKDFVANIVAIFGTVLPSKSNKQSTGMTRGILELSSSGQTDILFGKGEEQKILEEAGISLEAEETPSVQNRYPFHKDESAIHTYINEIVKEQLNKRQMIDSVSRNLLRFLTAVCGYNEVRLLASQRIEAWLQNPKLTRPAQELLISVALNCNTHSAEDVEVIANMVKMRLKTKPVANHYINCMRELISQHPDNLGTILKHVIYNELSQQRNPNNMATLGIIFSAEPDLAAKYLSLVFQDLLCNREDYLRALRALFREIVRTLKYEVNLVEFCRGMMQERKEYVFAELEQTYKDRMFQSVLDLICLGCLLSVSPAVKELAISLSKNEKRDYSVLQAFQTQISIIQRDAVWFFHTKVMPMYHCSEKDLVMGLNRVLFLDVNEHYSSKDNWPPESERSVLLQLVREVPLAEDALLRLHLLGFSEDVPINCADVLEIVERVVFRAAKLKSGLQGLEIEMTDVIKMLLSLAAYTHPKDIRLPQGYNPPSLAISALYWKSWLILLVLSAGSPSTIGLKVWEMYPTGHCMMEMLITGSYNFPPFGVGELSPQEIRGNDLQIQRAEKDDIIVFEGHLAAATTGLVITESSSLLINQLVSLDPSGPPRLPPKHIVEQLKTMNETYGLGKMLCHSREPDFLLSIIQSQGSSRMPWLADLVQSSESSLNALPVQCLCEFLLMKYNAFETDSHVKQKPIKPKVAARLQELLLGNDATEESSTELIKYFIQRWSSREMRDREAAVDGFQSILLLQKCSRVSIGAEESVFDSEEVKPSKKHQSKMMIVKDDTYSWLHDKLPSLPYFHAVKLPLMTALRQALYVEVDVPRLHAYIRFLTKHYKDLDEDFCELLAEDASQLITCRKTITKSLLSRSLPDSNETYCSLLDLFVCYFKMHMKPAGGDYQWHGNPHKISITWTGNTLHSGKCATLHERVAQASIALLTFASVLDNYESCLFLQKTWFPKEGSYEILQADTGEKTEILQHWLRMFMVQSNIDTLVQAGLKDLPCGQLVLFLQTSGMPVASLNRLLTLLDKAAENEPDELLQDIFDTDYIIQLVELAQSRGACGGEKLCALLNSDYQKEEKKLHVGDIENNLRPISEQDYEMKTDVEAGPSEITVAFVKKTMLSTFVDKKSNSVKDLNQLKKKLAIESMQVGKPNDAGVIESMQVGKPNDAGVIEITCTSLLELCEDKTFLEAFCTSTKETKLLLNCLSKGGEVRESVQQLFQKIIASELMSTSMTQTLAALLKNNKLSTSNIRKLKSQSRTFEEQLDAFDEVKSGDDLVDITKDLITLLKNDIPKSLPKEKLIKVCGIIFEKCEIMCEPFISALCTNATNARMSKSCIEILVEIFKSSNANVCGLLIDWLTMLDPEILHLNPTQQREFLFLERQSVGCALSHPTLYLTSVLVHQSRNATLQDCFAWLLNQRPNSKNLDATICLDFINAMFNNPRLWQGRENKQDELKKKCQRHCNQDRIEVNVHTRHLYNLMEIVLLELNNTLKECDHDPNHPRVTALMEKRLSLLVNLSPKQQSDLRKAVNVIRQKNKYGDRTLRCFLKYFYMKLPTVLPDLSKELLESDKSSHGLPTHNSTEMDDIIHRLLLSISEPTCLPEWDEKFRSVSHVNRRLAVKHPFAFIRQLPIILSMLRGKNRLSSATFKLTNQLMFCTHIFGLFDLLRPHVFAEDEMGKSTMMLFLDVFLDLIKSSCLSKDECSMFVKKLVEFLNHYISSGNKDVGAVLQKHEYIFTDLMYEYPNFQGLTSICTLISAWNYKSTSHPSLVAIHDSPLSEMQLASFKRRLSVDHHYKDLLAVIVDLDETSKRRTDIIEHFTEELSALASSSHEDVREKSHMLLIRHCKQNPRKSSLLIQTYLDCLYCEHPDVVLTAAKYISQSLLLVDEKCDVILKRMYDIAVRSVNTQMAQYVVTTIKTFNIDCV